MKNLIGTTINQYQILVKIRETGTRILYKAYDTQTFKYVGFDVVKIYAMDQPKLLDLLNKQSKKNAELVHSNIAVAVDSGIHDDIIFFVYNFLPAYSLRPLFNRTYSWQELSREMVPITQALTYAHEKGIYHCFLNPISIVVDENKNPILFDFGFEWIIADHIISCSPGSWINNWGFEYCSPEQLIGETLDGRGDIYAIGMILHEWVSGEIAFAQESAITTLNKRVASSSRELLFNNNVPTSIQKLIQKCLAANPADRFQSMQELSTLLARGALDLTVTEKMVKRPFLAAPEKPSLIRWVAIFIPIFLASIIVVLGLWKRVSSIENVEQPSAVSITPNSLVNDITTFTLPAATPETFPGENPDATQTPASSLISYPIYQETPLSSITHPIQIDNADQLINLSLWGIGDVNRLAASPDGVHVAVASSIGVFIYDFNTLKLQKQLDTRSWVSAVEFSPDGKLIAVGDRDGLIRLWETDRWQEIAIYSGHRMGILDLAFSPDGTRLASVAMDNTLIQWEIGSDENTMPISTSVSTVTCVVYSQDGSTIGTGGNDFKINLWGAKNLNLLKTITISSKVVDMTIINNSDSWAIGGSDRRVSIVDTKSNRIIRQLDGLQFTLSSVASSPDGEFIAGGDMNGGIIVWDRNGELIWRLASIEGIIGFSSALGNAHSLVFSVDGKLLVSALRAGTFRVLNINTSEALLPDQSLDVHVKNLEISRDGNYAISQNDRGKLNIWDVYHGKLLYALLGEIKSGNPFSQDSKYFAVATNQSTVKVYETSNGREYYVFSGHQKIETIQFISNGAQLAAGYEQMMHLWSMSSGQEIKTTRSFGGNGCTTINDLRGNPIFYVTKYNYAFENNSNSPGLCAFKKLDWMKAFSISESNGQAAYGGGSQLAVIDIRNAYKEGLEMSGVNRQNIVSVAINLDGSLLAAAYDDNTIHLWDIATQTELMRLYGHENSVADLQFSPDGKLLLSASIDGTIRLWGIPN